MIPSLHDPLPHRGLLLLYPCLCHQNLSILHLGIPTDRLHGLQVAPFIIDALTF